MTPCAARGIENVGPVGRNRRLHHPAPVAAGRSGLSEFSIHARGQYVAVAQHRLDGPQAQVPEGRAGAAGARPRRALPPHRHQRLPQALGRRCRASALRGARAAHGRHSPARPHHADAGVPLDALHEISQEAAGQPSSLRSGPAACEYTTTRQDPPLPPTRLLVPRLQPRPAFQPLLLWQWLARARRCPFTATGSSWLWCLSAGSPTRGRYGA